MKILDYSTGVWRITVDYGVECYIMLSEKKWPRWHHDDRGILFSKSGKKREREREILLKNYTSSFFRIFPLVDKCIEGCSVVYCCTLFRGYWKFY